MDGAPLVLLIGDHANEVEVGVRATDAGRARAVQHETERRRIGLDLTHELVHRVGS
jgi:hypothetical protein